MNGRPTPPGAASDSVAEAAGAAVAAVAAWLGPRGQWPGRMVPGDDPAAAARDLAAPLTALGVLALDGLDVAGGPEVVRRSRVHIEATVLPAGVWRYYADIPPDTDDTAMCALALGVDTALVRTRTAPALAATRRPDGRFPTWFEPGWNPVVDAVANAHVVAVVGPGADTDDAVDWLLDVVGTGREAAESAYYPDPLDLHVALTRAVAAGVGALQPAVETAATRALERLRASDLDAYRTAQAVVVASCADAPDRSALRAAADRLLGLREGGATWPEGLLFRARATGRTAYCEYRSRAVVTALCARAIVLSERP